MADHRPVVSPTTNNFTRRVDWIGAALVTSGLVLITFVLGQGELAPDGWRTPCTSHAQALYLDLGVILATGFSPQISSHFW